MEEKKKKRKENIPAVKETDLGVKYLLWQGGRVAKLVSRPLSMRKVPGSKPGMSIFFF